MWGGISRFKEHLAQKRGDVAACTMCPPELTVEMLAHLVELSLKRETKQRRKRENLEDLRKSKAQKQPPTLLPPQEVNAGEVDAEEKALIDQAIKESIRTHEMEEKKAKFEQDELEAACRASFHLHELESRRHGEGLSTSRAGPSDYKYEMLDEAITFYDSDLSF